MDWCKNGGKPMDRREMAEVLALQALAWLMSDDALAGQFLAASGADRGDLASRAGDGAFLGGVLDFLMEEDARVIAFCDQAGLAYERPMQARAALPGGASWHWT